jgi:hypothetical protein
MQDSHPHERILNALNLEKHLTGRQLARLLYPSEYSPETTNRAYERVMKNLKSLQESGLLKSKSYGLGREMLWSLTSRKIVKDLGYTPPLPLDIGHPHRGHSSGPLVLMVSSSKATHCRAAALTPLPPLPAGPTPSL